MVPKLNGGVRPILVLITLNLFLCVGMIFLENVTSVIATLLIGDFLTLTDILDAYLHIPSFPPHKRYLQWTVSIAHLSPFYLTLL